MEQKYIYHFTAMTTPCEVILYSDIKVKADKVAQDILKEVKRLEKKYNYYDDTSFLSQINLRHMSELDIETKTLLSRAKQYYKMTSGVFDITVATIKEVYRSNTKLDELKKEKEKLLLFVGCEHFEIKRNKIIFDNLFTKLDLGGFVKEYAVDQSVKIVKKHKIRSAMINFGGDLYVLGKKPDGQKFRVGIKDPSDSTKHVQFVELENQALTTSASYERNYQIEDGKFSHIMSKSLPSSTSLSVTVISSNCVESGVFSTALMIDPTIQHNHQSIII